ncbi:MAG: threonine synthase [Chloroflexi bacterium]|nr:threonine synthase [Chloroflexota bacterium]
MKILCSDCSREVPFGALGRCSTCGGILRPDYDGEAVNTLRTVQPGPGLDRYRALMPVSSPIPFLGEGDTPLIRSRRIGLALGLENLYFKNEGRNPSGAFKDRAAALAVALAIDAETKGMLTASSGNSASAISAYCAAAGLKCLILLEPGNPPAKLRQALATGAQVLPVKGIFGQGPEALRNLLTEVAARLNYYLGFVWAPINPYILEGIKTISYEIATRLPGAPDVVVAPVGGGDMFTAQWRGWLELKRAGVISKLPRMIGVQSVNAPPLLEAFRAEAKHVPSLPYANSKISGINVAFTGDHALAAVRESGGAVMGVKDEEVMAMQGRLGREEGIWVEPASAAPVTAIPELLTRGLIQSHEKVVCVFSGAGFKDAHLAEAEAAAINQGEPAGFEVEEIVKLAGKTMGA